MLSSHGVGEAQGGVISCVGNIQLVHIRHRRVAIFREAGDVADRSEQEVIETEGLFVFELNDPRSQIGVGADAESNRGGGEIRGVAVHTIEVATRGLIRLGEQGGAEAVVFAEDSEVVTDLTQERDVRLTILNNNGVVAVANETGAGVARAFVTNEVIAIAIEVGDLLTTVQGFIVINTTDQQLVVAISEELNVVVVITTQ